MREELRVQRDEVMSKLKAFQRATVERIDHIFRNTEYLQNRVLVADEVGLGKTLIAKGVIANLAVLRDEEHDDLFKVVYVCSNQAIARQNIGKLRVAKENRIDNSIAETRLSMQHLRVLEQEADCKKNKIFIQLTPLTPGTSFQITNSQGSAPERALMYCILSRKFTHIDSLSDFLRCDVKKDNWEMLCKRFEERIAIVRQSLPEYPENLIAGISSSLLTELTHFLTTWNHQDSNRQLIVKLRRMFAELSAEMLQPDLVVMDEFQRFQSLLNPPDDDDLRTITEKFLRCGAEVKARPRILLLSATPYKLYSTLDEIDDTQSDEHYREFMEVVEFLLDHDPVRVAAFRQIWQHYSQRLCELKRKAAMPIEAKQPAETALYDSGMCRTERISFVKDDGFLYSRLERLNVCEGDILSYVELCRILEKLKLPNHVPYEFAKSSPWLLSFMENYKLKQEIEKRLTTAAAKETVRGRGKHSQVWLQHDAINDYKKLPEHHAKLECLRKYAFENQAERLLWIPPSMAYYEPQGVFQEARDFSKLLIFSAWEMVPRMISSLISYDAECRTNGKLCLERSAALREKRANLHYFNTSRFPQKRLFSVRDKGLNDDNDRLAPEAEILRIQSEFLCTCYEPSSRLPSLTETRLKVRATIAEKAPDINSILCPPGMDVSVALVKKLDGNLPQTPDAEINQVSEKEWNVLTDMAIAAPGICVARALQHYFPDTSATERVKATEKISDLLMKMFDSTEGIGAIADSCAGLENYERKVLQYCVDGNFQAMFDEYCFLQKMETNGNLSAATENICTALAIRTAIYDVHTWESTVKCDDAKPLKLRSHYAVGFNKMTKSRRDTDTPEAADRKENVRMAFNSPFRPFVLASTSVGQEGLDFHYYCRRIMHWNLPHNPTELEQREGRINRYLCLAVRNSIVCYFRNKDQAPTSTDWDELLAAASAEAEAHNQPYAEISPYWCFSKDQPVKIERIFPLYSFSRDVAAYERLIKLLSLYRLTMGQARQEEILNAIIEDRAATDPLPQNLFISLCPFLKNKE